jgi:exopolysaccharide production protein ExoZ
MSKLVNIQILRAVAALVVVIYHLGVEATKICDATKQACAYDTTVGLNGIALFFMISGFIMVAISWDDFAKSGAAMGFLRRRLERIVPVYWIVTTLAVAGVMIVPSLLNVPVMDAGYILSSYLFWPMARVNGLVRPIANLGWTLDLEMMFYLVFTLALFWRRWAGMIFAIAILLILSILQIAGLFTADGNWPSVALNFWGDPIILNFIVGMLAAVIYQQGFRLAGRYALLLLGVAIIGLAGFRFGLENYSSALVENGLQNRLLGLVFALPLFIAGVFGPQMDTTKAFWRWAVIVGDASYSIYLLHPFVLRPVAKLWSIVVGSHLPPLLFIVVGAPLALAVSFCFYAFVERPFVNYFHRRRKLQILKGANSMTAPIAAQPAK